MEKFICARCLKLITKKYKDNNKSCSCGSETCVSIVGAREEIIRLRKENKKLRKENKKLSV